MIIHLEEEIFDLVKNGTKNVEVRINDDKRRYLKVGDTCTFLKRPLEKDIINAKITNLVYYSNFFDLVKNYDIKFLYKEGYSKKEFLKLLNKFYTEEEQKEYGVVAIEFVVI